MRRPWYLVFATVFVLTSSCVHENTGISRRESFAPYASRTVAGEPVWDFLASRTGYLLAGYSPVRRAGDGTRTRFTAQDGRAGTFGVGAAIDRRGYFLTAAHSLDAGALLLGVPTAQGVRFERPRIVWRGQPSRNEPDLAILHVPATLEHVFEWTSEFKRGDPILAAGLRYDEGRTNFAVEGFAGRILNAGNWKPLALSISHSAPAHKGDSGGPLTDTQGRLVGINVGGVKAFQIASLSYEPASTTTLRPDLNWLRQTIDADYARLSSVAAR